MNLSKSIFFICEYCDWKCSEKDELLKHKEHEHRKYVIQIDTNEGDVPMDIDSKLANNDDIGKVFKEVEEFKKYNEKLLTQITKLKSRLENMEKNHREKTVNVTVINALFDLWKKVD